MPLRRHHELLEDLYRRYNRAEFLDSDPIQFIARYDDPLDREVVGLVAACLAYGRVCQILRSVQWVLDRLGPAPADCLRRASTRSLARSLAGFRHRFQTTRELRILLEGITAVQKEYGSLEEAFCSVMQPGEENTRLALGRWTRLLDPHAAAGHLLPDPRRNSACKRLNLYLRWMARRDAVDPGVWRGLPTDRLVVPMDVHMHRMAVQLGATRRRSPDARCAAEVTRAFAAVCPHDPVRYDFALTRPGICFGGNDPTLPVRL